MAENLSGMAERLTEQVEIAVAGCAARMLDGLIAAQLAFALCDAGQMPEALAGEQHDEKQGTDDKRHDCMPPYCMALSENERHYSTTSAKRKAKVFYIFVTAQPILTRA